MSKEAKRMPENLIATASVRVDASRQKVWTALTDPTIIEKYMFGSRVTSDWKVGGTITYAGDYEGKTYEDHGEILEIIPTERLRSTHFSPLSGQPDVPENYHTLTYVLSDEDGGTRLSLDQDNNRSAEEVQHSAANWHLMLNSLKAVVESTP